MHKSYGLLITAGLLLAAVCCASMYYWVDEDGVKHYTNTPPGNTAATEQQEVAAEEEVTEVYPEEATRTERKTIPGSEPKAKPKPRPKARPASKQEYRQPKVIMYSTSSCGYCTMAREWFRKNDVKFTEYNVDKSRQARDQFHALNGRGVPLIFVGSQRINGFSSSLIRQALGR